MRNPFEREGAAARHLKIAVSGPPGSGKTCFGLDAKNHGLGPVAVISLESGEVQYQNSKRWGGFKPLRTQSIEAIREALEFLEANPGVFGTLVIDTVTGIYEAVVDAKMKEDGSMNQNTWGTTKRAWKSLMLRMVNLPMHVVFVSHELDLVEKDRDGNTKVTGQKLDAEKTFARAPDFWLRLTMQNGKPVGTVMKLRGESTGFVVGQKIDGPHLGMFVGGVQSGEQESRIALPEEVRDGNAAAVDAVKKLAPAPAPAPAPVEAEATPEQAALFAQLSAALAAGFRAAPHAAAWAKKHKAEIETLPEALRAQLREAFKQARIGGGSETEAA